MEAWHRKIQCLLGMTHPTIFKFIKGLACSQKLRDVEIEQLLAGRPQRAKKTITLLETQEYEQLWQITLIAR